MAGRTQAHSTSTLLCQGGQKARVRWGPGARPEGRPDLPRPGPCPLVSALKELAHGICWQLVILKAAEMLFVNAEVIDVSHGWPRLNSWRPRSCSCPFAPHTYAPIHAHAPAPTVVGPLWEPVRRTSPSGSWKLTMRGAGGWGDRY